MQDIHPHWQSTEATVLQSSPGQPARSTQRKKGNRRIAALVGIALVSVFGLFVFGHSSFFVRDMTSQTSRPAASLTTSVPADAVSVTITQSGLDPQKITVRPGQTVVWSNKSALPHIFMSNDLKDDSDNQSMYSPAIFPDTSQTFVVSRAQAEGTYSYESVTASDVKGEIVVVGAALSTGTTGTTGAQPSTMPGTTPSATTPITSNDPLLQGFSLNGDQPKDPYQAPLDQEPLIPVNPNTYDRNGPSRPVATVTDQPLHTGAPSTPRPVVQPSSGAETWVIALVLSTMLGIGVLLIPRKAK